MIHPLLLAPLVFTPLLLGFPLPAIGQISGDGTLPIPTQVTQSDNAFTITNGTQAGSNLFHSFSQFSVPTGGVADFNTTQYSGIRNIFSRVTGGAISSIDGQIRLTPTGANFFFLNPSGVIFGPNASLNLGGSFLVTTGNSIRFADGTEFSANAQAPAILTVRVPIGVQFGQNPGSIQVNGSNLQRADNTIALLGGDITIAGGDRGFQGNSIIAAPRGRIELGSVDRNSFVNLTFVNQGLTLGYAEVQSFRDIQILQNALLDANNGGNVNVQGRAILLSGGSQVGTLNSSALIDGGTVTVNATESVTLLGTGLYQSANGVAEFPTLILNRTSGARNAGTLTLNTRQLTVKDGGLISASTSSTGQSGNLTINAAEAINVSGFSPTLPSLFSGISVTANRTSTGNAGNLVVNTPFLSVKDGAQVSASTFGRGQGGSLTVNAAEIELSGGSATRANGLFVQVGVLQNNDNATGQGGTLTVNTESLSVLNGSRVSTSTFGAGNAGSLVLSADRVLVAGRSPSDGSPSLITASSAGRGAAGNLSVLAEQVRVQDGGQITVSGTSTGVAGNMEITSPFIELNNQGVLLAETRAGQGNITLNTRDLRLRNNSVISTNATGIATGGNIRISTQTLVALENSDITANAQESFGGRVSIRATAIFGTRFRPFLTPDSDITATSALGPEFSGAVILQTPGIDPSQGLLQLQTDVVDVSQLVVEACTPAQQQARGEFFITGRGGLPASPTDAVTDDRVLVDLGHQQRDRIPPTSSSAAVDLPSGSAAPVPTTPIPLLQAQGWVVNETGKVVLVAQAPTAIAPRVSGLRVPFCK